MDIAAILEPLDAAIEKATTEELPALAGVLAEAQCRLQIRLQSPRRVEPQSDADRNINAEEAGRRLGLSPDWLYREARLGRLPFAARVGRRVLFSLRGLEKWNRQRMGR